MKQEQTVKEMVVNGVTYIPKDSAQKAALLDGMKYAIVRTYAAGVFAGYLEKTWTENGLRMAIVKKARRLWYWKNAASLSELAMKGTGSPKECKFPCEVDSVELINVVEILDCTKQAQESIKSVPEWTEN